MSKHGECSDRDDRRLVELAETTLVVERDCLALIREAEDRHGPGAYEEHPDYVSRYKALERRQDALISELRDAPAATLEGVKAKLRALLTEQELKTLAEARPPFDDINELVLAVPDLARLLKALARDVLRRFETPRGWARFAGAGIDRKSEPEDRPPADQRERSS